MTDRPDLPAIKARLDAITGPWAIGDRSSRNVIAGMDRHCVAQAADAIPTKHWSPNADFIGHAPEDIAALLAEVERLRAALAALAIAYTGHDFVVARDLAKAKATAREALEELDPTSPTWATEP
jgi:hypothetical protein